MRFIIDIIKKECLAMQKQHNNEENKREEYKFVQNWPVEDGKTFTPQRRLSKFSNEVKKYE